MTDRPRLLVVDDESGHRQMIRAVMEDEGYLVLEAENGRGCLEVLAERNVDVVMLDMKMPVLDGMDTLEEIRKLKDPLPVIMLTAFGSVGSAVEAMKSGAFDYLTKPADIDELKVVVSKAYDYRMLTRENAVLKDKIASLRKKVNIIGQSRAMNRVMELVEQVGPTEANVLILGESGTGKELIAKALHEASARKEGPMVKVNCAALPSELLESELFGHRKGAFTGALRDKPGRFQLAEKGTLFLDEIGDLPVQLQAKLLRALQERVVEPLGSVGEEQVDVRLLAATNKDLAAEVRENRFRQDLYFRLNVLEIRIPPLRDRLDDLPLLVNHFVRVLGEKNRKQVRGVDRGFLEALYGYHWPGNVRELENVVERAIILSRSDVLEISDLPSPILEAGPEKPGRESGPGPMLESVDKAEKKALVRALEVNNGHREKTAKALGISRRSLQYKLKKHGLIRPYSRS
ncbi:sigma-54-dependent transcriptional regulator [Desulfonatronovibrio hydrogenovorans]|uniref:sigma-54-dependent transcriptional regulator n=1 Tax=Desulfonatronovibrio hydrogenovorans TaxID=53245 RepID=UPI00049162B8|nr:sigma-54 dependent transcriptional regulator [Desulfonatronovibrio hydrogenovorans]